MPNFCRLGLMSIHKIQVLVKNIINFDAPKYKLNNPTDTNKDEDEEDLSSGRQSRIEQLAKKIMEEEAMLAQYESRQRHGSSNLEPKSGGALKRDPINLNAELDTVSERSEIDEDPTIAESIKRGKTYFLNFQLNLNDN